MKRAVWKWLLGISVVVLILLVLFTLSTWVLINAGGAFMLAMLSAGTGNTEVQFRGMSMASFLANFVGSPIFYAYLVDITVLVVSVAMLIVTKKRRASEEQRPELEENE